MPSTSGLPRLNRRAFVAAAAGAAICAPALAQHPGHGTPLPEATPAADPFSRLQGGTPHHLTTEQMAQRKVDSPAPKGPQGRWTPKAALPLPRSEMAWATAWAGRMHIVGGYGEGRVDRAYHHVYDPKDDRWFNAAPLPRGANHVAVVADAGRSTRSAASSSRTAFRIRTPSPTRWRPTAGRPSRRCRVRAAPPRRWCSTASYT